MSKKLKKIATEKNVAIDWDKVERILKCADGIPTPILTQSPDLPEMTADAVKLEHPYQLYGQPLVRELNDSDWSILAASFPSETDAQKLAAMLNHQGPPIPARTITKNSEFQVIAGPFKNKKETNTIAKRIKQNFDMDVTVLDPPRTLKN